MIYGIPVKGTHAHSWVMSHDDEHEAFEQYANAMPNNAVLLVDTYDTVEGVKKAIEVGKQLKMKGHELLGVRLDSGDLVDLSRKARELLDQAGFTNTRIVASNDLDDHTIKELKRKGAKIDTWGIGTKLVTAYDQPALGGVYKLAAIENDVGSWDYKVKLSNDLIKVSNPGRLQVLRQRGVNGEVVKDILFNELDESLEDIHDGDLLLEVKMKNGARVDQAISIWKSLTMHDDVLVLSDSLLELKKKLVAKYRNDPNQ